MKVLLANPATRVIIDNKYERFFIKAGSRWPWSTIKPRNKKNDACFFPFYLAYCANILKEDGNEVYVIDGVARDMQDDEFLQRVGNIRPEVVIIETQTHSFNYDVILCERIKSLIPQAKLILTGAHVTVFAREILEKITVVDFVTLGEYELTVRELMRKINSGEKDFKIDGLGYRREKEIWISDKKGFIEDINILSFPAFELFPTNDEPNLSIYSDGICTYRPAVTLHSSRGCPFKCDFCLWNQVMYDNRPYRMFSPQRVVEEMEYVIKHFKAKEIYFDDDDFCINKQHVLEICNEIKKRNLNLKWSCMGDAICTDEEMIQKMAEAGCIFMKFGVESGNRDILKRIGKPLDPQRAIKIPQWCRRYGIRTHATFSFGLDGETLKTMEDTLKLANKIKFDYAQVSIATPFPGTRYYEKLLQRRQIKELDWQRFDGTCSCVFSSDKLTAAQIENFRKKAIHSMVWHKIIDPIWLMRYLERAVILAKNQGWAAVLAPIKAMYYTFFGK